jgi:hypothetical protein
MNSNQNQTDVPQEQRSEIHTAQLEFLKLIGADIAQQWIRKCQSESTNTETLTQSAP